MDKIDLKKELKNLYNPSAKEVTVVDVPAMNFLLLTAKVHLHHRSIVKLLKHYLVSLIHSNLWLRKARA